MVIGLADEKDGEGYLQKQKDYDLVIKSPGIRKELVSIPYTTATNIFFANIRGKTIGVTGSKGKSTTTSIIYDIVKQAGLRARLVGNIGNPMLLELLKSNSQDDVWICELSSFQLSDIDYSPHISVILNIFPEHMDYHGNVENYYEAKKRMLAAASNMDYFVYNPAFEELRDLANKLKVQTMPFVDALPFDEKIIPLLGEHNKDNVRAAVTVAKLLKIDDKAIEAGVKNFKPLSHRLELVGTFKGITFYDDAISTTPQSTIKAIEALENIGTIFLGGQDRGYNFTQLIDVVVNKKIPNVVLFPNSGGKMGEGLKGKVKNILETESMQEAVRFAYQHTPAGSICLLSCASPSFSLWKNFEEKGDSFQEFVKEYGR